MEMWHTITAVTNCSYCRNGIVLLITVLRKVTVISNLQPSLRVWLLILIDDSIKMQLQPAVSQTLWTLKPEGTIHREVNNPWPGFEKRRSLKTETAMFHIPKRWLSQKITLRHFSKDETRQKFQISNFEKTRQDRNSKLQILKRQDRKFLRQKTGLLHYHLISKVSYSTLSCE
jgi:hypothetical protein